MAERLRHPHDRSEREIIAPPADAFFFLQTGLAEDLISPDASRADKAIAELTQVWFDDGHSGFNSSSCLAKEKPQDVLGYSYARLSFSFGRLQWGLSLCGSPA